jgi:hypothetical protein
MNADLPEPPGPEPTPEGKKGFIGRGLEKSQQAIAERNAAKQEAIAQQQAAIAQQQAAAETERARLAATGHHFSEYKVIFVREKLIGDKIDTDKLEVIVNRWARQGWHLKTITSAQVGGRVGPGGVDGLIITLERPVLT